MPRPAVASSAQKLARPLRASTLAFLEAERFAVFERALFLVLGSVDRCRPQEFESVGLSRPYAPLGPHPN
eukprot:5048408-Heterocapsa_arctica.AAC.1